MGYFLKCFSFSVFYTFLTVYLPAQTPDTAWTKTFGGTSYDFGYSVKQTRDGGFIISGSTWSFGAGGYDVYLIKTDSLGDTLWTRTFGGAYHDQGSSVLQTTDGGYIVAGSIDYSDEINYDDVYLIKTDSLGDTLWTRTFGGDNYDEGRSVRQTNDGGYIVLGSTWSYGAGSGDVYLIKTDSFGDTLWTKAITVSGYDIGISVWQTTDGGYIITGTTDNLEDESLDEVFLVKTDSLGDTLWTKIYGRDFYYDQGYSVQQTTDGGYIVVGHKTFGLTPQEDDVYLIKTDSLGDTLWTKIFMEGKEDGGFSVEQTSDGCYVITGHTEGSCCLIKIDTLSNILWDKTFSGGYGREVHQTYDNGYIIVSSTRSRSAGLDDVYLIKVRPDWITLTSPNGGEKWKVDSTDDINWISTGTSGNVNIEYSLNGGLNWIPIVTNSLDDGTYSWTIPDTTSDSGLVKVSDTDGEPSDISDSVFTISHTPSITVTKPNGGEKWEVDSTYDITWLSNGTSFFLNIYYSVNGGLDWITVITNKPDDGSYSWTIPDVTSDSCLVKIIDESGSVSDMSDSVFAILPISSVSLTGLPVVYSIDVKGIITNSELVFRYALPEKANNIKFFLYNIAGLKIKEKVLKEIPAGFFSEKIDVQDISKGIYFIKMEVNGGKFTKTKKFVLM